MRKRTAVVVLAGAVASFGIWASSAAACSCTPLAPCEQLTDADAAFIGVLVSKRVPDQIRRSGDPAVYTFRVERVVKGSSGPTVDVVTAVSGATCGLEAVRGQLVGLFVYRHGDAWTSGLCSQVDPKQLSALADERHPSLRHDIGTLTSSPDRDYAWFALPGAVVLAGGALAVRRRRR